MKLKIFFLLTALSLAADAANPDFTKIFSEIKNAQTASSSIGIRKKYLPQIKNLSEFDRLTDLEQLEEGEGYFDHYRKALSSFVLMSVNRFMLDKKSDEEQDLFAKNIVPKGFDFYTNSKLLEKGLFYVDSCEDFESYIRMSEADSDFILKFESNYCNKTLNQTLPGKTFELISNLSLVEGEYKILYLPSKMFVKKLYVSVEGISSDAFFDIMVNGDIKGTIYAPGRDPLYIINVSETTNVINLRSMFGSAYISSIKVEFK